MNRSLVQLLVLGIVVTLAGKTTASRNTRQDRTCSAGQQCILLESCPKLKTISESHRPAAADIRLLQERTCNSDRSNPKVCCDVSAPVTITKPVTPTKPITPTQPVTHPTTDLLPKQCGSANGERVFGGTELTVGTYRWMALIGYGSSSRPDWHCGGSLISKHYVITAAHCNDQTITGGLRIVKIRLGEHDISKNRDCQQFNTGTVCALPVQDFNPKYVINHPDWNTRTTYSDDIALIRLDRPAKFNDYVQPICLPKPGLDVSAFLNGRKAEVAGWGYTERKDSSNVKLKVELPLVPLENCKLKRPVENVPLVEKGQVCFGGEVGKDACIGDSGGPLVSTDLNANSNNLYILLGIVSYGLIPKQCGSEDRPGVYTDVAQYRNWIVSKLQP